MAMSSSATPDDPRGLLAGVEGLTRRVRHDQGAAWFALAVFGAITLLATPFYRFGPTSRHCTAHGGAISACTVYPTLALWYWPVAVLLGYATVAWLYLRRSRQHGIGTRVGPYVAVGLLLGLAAAAWLTWALAHPDFLATSLRVGSSTSGSALFRLAGPSGAIGVALLVLAWVERTWLLGAVSVISLAAVVTDSQTHHSAPSRWVFLPHLLLVAGILLVGAVVLAVAHRSSRPARA